RCLSDWSSDVCSSDLSYFGERGIRQLFLGNAVKVGPNQRPALNQMWTEVLDTLDWPDRPELYVTQTPIANAMAVGFERPFVVVRSEERRGGKGRRSGR